MKGFLWQDKGELNFFYLLLPLDLVRRSIFTAHYLNSNEDAPSSRVGMLHDSGSLPLKS